MLRHFLLSLMGLVALFVNASKPDFAFPATVRDSSRVELQRALRHSDGELAVRSLINYVLAQSAIDTDSVDSSLALIEHVGETAKSDDVKALCALLRARLLCDVYQSCRYTADRRMLPLEPLPQSVSEWSGQQFRDQVLAAIDSALRSVNPTTPLKNWLGLTTLTVHELPMYPSLYDFTAYESLSILDALGGETETVNEIYRDLFRHNSTSVPAAIVARVDYLTRFRPAAVNDSLMALAQQYAGSPYAAEALLGVQINPEASMSAGQIDCWKRLVAMIRAQLSAHPDYGRNNCLRNNLSALTAASAVVNLPSACAPTDSLTVDVSILNTTRVKLRVIKVPTTVASDTYNYKPTRTDVVQASVNVPVVDTLTVPFVANTRLKLPPLPLGRYIVAPVIDGNDRDIYNTHHTIVRITGLLPISTAFASKHWASALNIIDGSPVAGATVSTRNSSGGVLWSQLTDKTGQVSVPVKQVDRRLHVVKGADRYCAPLYQAWSNQRPGALSSMTVTGYTSLPLYHPGDTVRFAAVLQSAFGYKARTLSSVKLIVVARDPNGVVTDTTRCTTDDYGRIDGSVGLPTQGLTGQWTLTFSQEGDMRRLGQKSFTVSDYKMPSYKVEITNITNSTPLTIKGNAVTYSQFPVADAAVALCLTAQPRYDWRMRRAAPEVLLRDTVATDTDGNFLFTVSDSILSQSRWSEGLLTASVDVTDRSGESVFAHRAFTLGPRYTLSVQLPQAINADDSVAMFKALISDIDGNTVTSPLVAELFRNGVPVTSQTTDDCRLNVSQLPSGQYGILFRTVDSTLATATDTLTTVIYRTTDKLSPIPQQLLWTPEPQIATSPEGRAAVTYALGDATGWLHYALATDTVLIERSSIHPGQGMHTLDIALPDGVDNAQLTLWCAGNYTCAQTRITLTRPTLPPTLNIAVESMRDNITSGSRQQWTIRVTDSNGTPAAAALMLDIFAQPLTTLAPQSLSLTRLRAMASASFNINAQTPYTIYQSAQSTYRTLKCTPYAEPAFDTYGQSFYPIRYYSRGILFNSQFKMAAGAPVNGAVVDMAEKFSTTDAVELEEAKVEDADAGAAESMPADASLDESFDYRELEVPLALFDTRLSTGSDGSAQLSFTMPDANTTWRLLALAFDKSLNIGTLQHDIVASKPIMVNANLPRFLRQGDTAEVVSTVMNLSDSTVAATTVVETFDPATRCVLSTYTHTDTIAPRASTTVTSSVMARSVGLLGYRVRSSSQQFTDGEQTLLAVLPAAQPVVTSSPFYFDSSDSTVTVNHPEPGKATTVVNTNPVWSVVTALPGLTECGTASADNAIASMFGASTAAGLMRREPWIAQGLKTMVDNPTDSALISALQRNTSLKTLMLTQTPWVSAAMSQTERMSRLALALDTAAVSTAIDNAVTQLQQLQLRDGGLSWRKQWPISSVVITTRLLLRVGQLNSLGLRPYDRRLDAVTARALAYCDSVAAFNARKYKDYTDLNYTYMRSLFASYPQAAGARMLSTRTVASVKRNWKSLPLETKPLAALVLDAHGHRDIARQVLESIRQYGVANATLGLYFPSLTVGGDLTATAQIYDVFRRIDPTSGTAGRIAQWLLLQKEARDWGASASTSWVVASLLAGANAAEYAVPQMTLTTPDDTATVSADGVSAVIQTYTPFSLSIAKQPGYPLWGATVTKREQLPSQVKAHSAGELAITKRLLKQMPDGTWREATEFAVGDVVRITLTVKSGRTLDYVAITDPRAAAFEPIEQLPGYTGADGVAFYRENNDAATNFFINTLPRGTYVISYEVTVNNAGTFTSGIATAQSQYAPGVTANSSAPDITVNSTNH